MCKIEKKNLESGYPISIMFKINKKETITVDCDNWKLTDFLKIPFIFLWRIDVDELEYYRFNSVINIKYNRGGLKEVENTIVGMPEEFMDDDIYGYD